MVERISKMVQDPSIHNNDFLGGKILSRGRKFAKVETVTRWAPDGPWYTHQHKVRLDHILETVQVAE